MDDSDARFEALIDRILAGELGREEALERYPALADRLHRRLSAVAALQTARDLGLQAPPRARLRARLTAHTQAHPRPETARPQPRWGWAIAGLALALIALSGTTTYAQTALPGQALYPLKIASEAAWVDLGPENGPVRLALLQRRADELIAVQGDPIVVEQAEGAFADAARNVLRHHGRLSVAQVEQAIVAQQARLRRAGIEAPLPGLLPSPPSQLAPPLPTPTALEPPASSSGTPPVSQGSGGPQGTGTGSGATPTPAAGSQSPGAGPGAGRNAPGQPSHTPRSGP